MSGINLRNMTPRGAAWTGEQMSEQRPVRFQRWAWVHDTVKRSRSQIWRDIKAGLFPAPRQTGRGSVAWVESEILDWVASRPRAAGSPSAQQDNNK